MSLSEFPFFRSNGKQLGYLDWLSIKALVEMQIRLQLSDHFNNHPMLCLSFRTFGSASREQHLGSKAKIDVASFNHQSQYTIGSSF